MEYTYRTAINSAAGTMDVATHTSGEAYRFITRVQKSGNTLNIHVSYYSFVDPLHNKNWKGI